MRGILMIEICLRKSGRLVAKVRTVQVEWHITN